MIKKFNIWLLLKNYKIMYDLILPNSSLAFYTSVHTILNTTTNIRKSIRPDTDFSSKLKTLNEISWNKTRKNVYLRNDTINLVFSIHNINKKCDPTTIIWGIDLCSICTQSIRIFIFNKFLWIPKRL